MKLFLLVVTILTGGNYSCGQRAANEPNVDTADTLITNEPNVDTADTLIANEPLGFAVCTSMTDATPYPLTGGGKGRSVTLLGWS